MFIYPMTLIHFPGHCYLMQDDLQKAYSAYQQALYLLPNPKVRRSYNYCTFLKLTRLTLGRSQAVVRYRHPL